MTREHKARERRRAFTLVEMLVVLGIITFLAAVTVAAIWPFMSGQALSGGARTLQAMIYQARAYAIANRTQATLYLDPNEKQMVLFATPEDLDSALGAGDSRQYRADRPEFLPKGAKFGTDGGQVVMNASDNGIGNIIVFSTTGSIESATVTLTNHPNWTVGTGNVKVKIQDPAETTTKVLEIMFASGFPRIYDE